MTFDELLQENYKMVGINYRPTLELTEQQLNENQQIFLDEIAFFMGAAVVSIYAIVAMNTAPVITGLGIGIGALIGGLSVAAGAGAVVALRKTDRMKVSLELDKVVNQRDEFFRYMKDDIAQGKEPTSNAKKIKNLTRDQISLGKKLEKILKADIRDGNIERDKAKSVLDVAAVAAQGKLTYIKTK